MGSNKLNYIPPYSLTSNMVNLVSEISDAVTRLEYSEKAFATPRLRKKNRVKTLSGTLEIEGNHLGEEKITAILEGKRVLGTVTEVAEVKGAIRAYAELESYNPASMDDLLQAHRLLMNDLLTQAGKFRTIQVGVGQHVAPPAARVHGLMSDLFQWLQASEEHPLINSCLFHYEFEFIHPFVDGNGRMGRLWQTVILYQWRNLFSLIPTESIVRDQQEAYYQALECSGVEGSCNPFIEFMLNAILLAVQSSVKSAVKSAVNTDERILAYFKQNPTGTVKPLAEELGLSLRAVEKHIAALKADGALIRTGSPRKGTWEVTR